MTEDNDAPERGSQDEYSKSSKSRFRFKSRKRSRSPGRDDRQSRRHKRRERDDPFGRNSHKSYSEPPVDDPSLYDEDHVYNARSGQYVDPDTLFRESLFDALADDEGAAYWEDVYGQPINVFSDTKPGPDGELERMNDEEYAEHVRRKMWEKTHQYLIEEREKRDAKRKQFEEERRREQHERKEYRETRDPNSRENFLKDIDEALHRGSQRRKDQKWKEAWHRYVQDWEKFQTVVASKQNTSELTGKAARGVIPWPVDTGRWKHVEKQDIENFFDHAVPSDIGLQSILKLERIRWHPDKMQQRFGANKLDDETRQKVTLVFQIVDSMWSNLKKPA